MLPCRRTRPPRMRSRRTQPQRADPFENIRHGRALLYRSWTGRHSRGSAAPGRTGQGRGRTQEAASTSTLSPSGILTTAPHPGAAVFLRPGNGPAGHPHAHASPRDAAPQPERAMPLWQRPQIQEMLRTWVTRSGSFNARLLAEHYETLLTTRSSGLCPAADCARVSFHA
jgi:hypothetical protein